MSALWGHSMQKGWWSTEWGLELWGAWRLLRGRSDGQSLESWPGTHVLGESEVSPACGFLATEPTKGNAFAFVQAAHKALAYVRSSRACVLALRAVSHWCCFAACHGFSVPFLLSPGQVSTQALFCAELGSVGSWRHVWRKALRAGLPCVVTAELQHFRNWNNLIKQLFFLAWRQNFYCSKWK